MTGDKVQSKGFTIVEMLVAVAVFMVVVTISTSVFIDVTTDETRVKNLQAVQEDVRFSIETMAADIRQGKIDYDYYRYPSRPVDAGKGSQWTDPITSQILLDRSGNGGAINKIGILVLRDQDYNQIFYHYDSAGFIETCTNIYGGNDLEPNQIIRDRCNNSNNWEMLTPNRVQIEKLEFIITPASDPFFQPIGKQVNGDSGPDTCRNGVTYDEAVGQCACPTDAECWTHQFCNDAGFCQNPDQQPSVTMVIEAVNALSVPGASGEERIQIQTTVTSRSYER